MSYRMKLEAQIDAQELVLEHLYELESVADGTTDAQDELISAAEERLERLYDARVR